MMRRLWLFFLIADLWGFTLPGARAWIFARDQTYLDSPEAPVASFAKEVFSQEKEEDILGRPLRDYKGLEPVSNRLKANIERVSNLGQALALKCQSPSSATIKRCTWTDPSGSSFDVNEAVDGIKAVISDDHVCQIQIESLSAEQLGKWSCRIEMDGFDQYQEAFLTATSEVPVTDVRLPRHAIPQSYVIHLTPFIIPNNFTIEGHVSIDIDVSQDANNITLHIKDITIYENLVSLTSIKEGKEIDVEGHGYDEAREFYIVKANVKAGQKYRLSIAFEAQLNDDLAGLYRSSYKSGNETKYIATSQMEATDARRALPCFDEPNMKAKFQTNLGRLKSMTSISNMPMIKEAVEMADTEDYVWDQFEESLQMSTYLLAFVVSDFQFKQGLQTSNGVEFRIWSRAEALAQTEYASQIGPQILQYYEDYFNVPFPLPKQDMIALTDFSAGAMENWGLITYRETALLHDPEADSKSRRIYVSTVVAHELAHQWFGDLVTMKWWDDLWLNEGFASYVETIGAAHVEPEASILERFCLDNTYDTFEIDALQTSHPISAKVKHPDEINEIFDRISYGKGASIIRMMYHFLGEDTFVEGLTLYLNRHKYANAEQDDLWQALTEVAHNKRSLDKALSVKEIMDTWTLQMGYPVVTVMRDYANHQAKVSQKRFLTGSSSNTNDDHDYKWWVPISFDFEGGHFNRTFASHWLSPDEKEIVIDIPEDHKDKALILNVQETGYYRVNYDLDNWNMIVKALENEPSSINRVNRGQIFNDLFSLAKGGEVSYTNALEMTKYLFNEDDYIPWRSGLLSLSYLRLMMQRSAGYGLFKKYMTSEMIRPYRVLGFTALKSDSIDTIDLRTNIISWMCLLGYDDCIRQSDDLFKNWMASNDPDNNNPINPAVRSTVYCQAIADGDEKTWNFLWNRLKTTSNANERNNIFRGLACTREVWILQRYLDMTIEPESIIRKQDGSTVIASIARNSVGRYMTWNWLRNSWKEISTYFDTAISSAVGNIVKYVTRDFNTPFELMELEQFYAEHKDELGTAKRATLNCIENVRANVEWMDKNYEVVFQWLKENVGEDFSPNK